MCPIEYTKTKHTFMYLIKLKNEKHLVNIKIYKHFPYYQTINYLLDKLSCG